MDMEERLSNGGDGGREQEIVPRPPDDALRAEMLREIASAGGELEQPSDEVGSVGRTMFDAPNAQDNLVPVLLPKTDIRNVPSQSLIRIRSKEADEATREYLGIVVEGPFHEPDNMRADAPIIVTATVRGAVLVPNYHGRVHVEILGELVQGEVLPPRFRPLPTSAVFVLDEEETALRLGVWEDGYVRLGLAMGHEGMKVGLPPEKKDVLPRHMAVLGTTGGGKSTSVAGIVSGFQQAAIATVLLDTEGEYTRVNEPTGQEKMRVALEQRGLEAHGVENTHVYHLVGRETSNPGHPSVTEFSLRFGYLSPYAVMEIMDFNDAQRQRYMQAYDIAKSLLRQLKIYPTSQEEEARVLELDELERGYPRMTLGMMVDVVRACTHAADKKEGAPFLVTPAFFAGKDDVMKVVKRDKLDHPESWGTILGRLSRLLRLQIFDHPDVKALDFRLLTQPGRVSIVDLSDTDSPQINNLVIAELLRGLMKCQESNYENFQAGKEIMRRTMVVIEEAHEFLSSERIKQMPVLFQQVARIARRGRKRWLGLMFVTQLPQNLPDEILGLVNTFLLHKINDNNVISRLKRMVGGVDEGLWRRLPNLAPGQAIIAAPSLARPLLVAMDPTPAQLRMVD